MQTSINKSIEVINDLSNYFSYNSIVILSFFTISFIFFILNKITHNKINKIFMLKRSSIFNPMLYIRMITCSFCHLNFEHFRNNFSIILLIGPILEEKYGSINLLIMIVLTSIISSIIELIFTKNNALGASDIVFMLIVLSSIVNIKSGKIPITLILILLFYVVDELIKSINHKKDGISHLSHITGAICGIIFGLFFF